MELYSQTRIAVYLIHDPYNSLGFLYSQKGELTEAIVYFQQALTIQPNFPKAQQNLILTLEQLKANSAPVGL